MPNRTATSDRTSSTKPAAPAPEAAGLIGVFRTLADQHTLVAQLFDQLRADPGARAVLWPKIRQELVSHEHSEVRELYPVLRQYEATRPLADHHDDEARALDALIARLDASAVSDAAWTELFEQLVTTVLHHAKQEEEAQIFPIAQRTIGETLALELDAKVALAKQQLAEAN